MYKICSIFKCQLYSHVVFLSLLQTFIKAGGAEKKEAPLLLRLYYLTALNYSYVNTTSFSLHNGGQPWRN